MPQRNNDAVAQCFHGYCFIRWHYSKYYLIQDCGVSTDLSVLSQCIIMYSVIVQVMLLMENKMLRLSLPVVVWLLVCNSALFLLHFLCTFVLRVGKEEI
jgi:heme/copper-type cytochrome/quinol oxidase subunit 1